MNTIESGGASASLIDRVKNILLSPKAEWLRIRDEVSTTGSITTGYVMILAAIPAVAMVIGQSLVGISMFGATVKIPIMTAVLVAALTYALSIASVFIIGFLIDALATTFGGEPNKLQAFKVAAYSATAMWVAGIFGLVPLLGVLGLLGLYSLYLLFTGLPILMKSPPEKALGYTAVVVVLSIVINLIIGAITTPIMLAGMAANGGIPAITGDMNIKTPEGNVTVNNGDLAAAAQKMEAAAKAMQDGTAKPPVEASKLEALLPAQIGGAAKSDVGMSSGGAGNYSGSEANATYRMGDSTIELKISDIGALGAMTAMGTAMKVQSSSQSGNSYEKVNTENGRLISESYDGDNKSGRYTMVLAERIVIEASGSNVDMATLKSAVASINTGAVEALVR